MTSDKARWKYNHPELTEHCGNVPGLDKFDAQFFMVHYRLSNSMDAMSRKLLEHSYQAVFDAGESVGICQGESNIMTILDLSYHFTVIFDVVSLVF